MKKKKRPTTHRISATTKKDVKYSLTIIGEEDEKIELTQADFDMIVSCGENHNSGNLPAKKSKTEKKNKNKTVPFATLTIVKGKKYYYNSKKLKPKKAEKKFEKGLAAVIDRALHRHEMLED